ncbi:MAG TPA: response regulator [Candidatus Angelobacter sp.]|nr:response regulator [Candidatus Angelobacter sp.]
MPKQAPAGLSQTEGPENQIAPGNDRAVFSGGGELGSRILAFDWSKTPLGPLANWPQSLKNTVRILISSRYAMWMGWGKELTFLYNDAYAHMSLGKKHPWALGKPSQQVWAEIWNEIGPRLQKVFDTGEATWDEGLLLFLERSGYTEETYHTFSYSPLTSDDGRINGNLCVVTEETERIIGERRLASLRTLAAELSTTSAENEVLAAIQRSLGANLRDLPFTITYLFQESATQLRLACSTGIEAVSSGMSQILDVKSPDVLWPIAELLQRKTKVVVENLSDRVGTVPRGGWDKPPERALLVPITRQGQDAPIGVMVAGLNPYRPFDDAYSSFIDLLAGQIAAGIANARAYQEERKRAEALAEIDRAKTAFFSNVSHEFRTPLTLMLGPTEDALAGPQRALVGAELETVHRHELRLLKLVNTLLDFSRLEAGRVKARYRATDLCSYTLDLASVFRSAMERAGLTYFVECSPLPQEVYVDLEMWEKIVLNLISNALKSTFEGSVVIRLTHRGDHAELVVRDTGTGIEEKEIPQLFERFRRIEHARRRTHEGSGIGLALVHELVNMHGGTIRVESKLGKGTSFVVALPYGSKHLPPEQIAADGRTEIHGTAREAFLQEALSWLPKEPRGGVGAAHYAERADLNASTTLPGPASEKAAVLLVDDNRDMREYVQRLLSSRFRVTTAKNGRDALAKATASVPDLVLSDVMMPEMDGFQLLAELRRNPSTSSVPVILLSARAGEESLIEGMQSGADDYLVKPFTARELLARVAAHLNIARFRRQAMEREAQLERELQDARARAAEALDHISDIFTTLDSNWKYTYVNTAGQKLLGVSADEIIGSTIWERYPFLRGTELETQYRRCMELRTSSEFEHVSPMTGRAFRIRVFPAPDGGIVSSSTDITERRRAEQQLRLKQEHLMLTQQAAKIGSWELDLQEEELSISAEFAEIIGLPTYVSRLRYSDFLNALFVSSDRQSAQAALDKAIHGGKDFAVELRLRRPDGAVRIVSNRGKVFYNQGRPSVLGVLVDVTPAGGLSVVPTVTRIGRKKTAVKRKKRA